MPSFMPNPERLHKMVHTEIRILETFSMTEISVTKHDITKEAARYSTK